jgi:hypothetical protein
MFDGINALYKVVEKDSHLTRLSCWERLYYEATAKPVDEVKTAEIRGLHIALKPSIIGSNFLIKGSIHKWHNSGEDNSNQFTFKDVQIAVSSLSYVFDIEPEKIELHGLEIGTNIKLPYPVLRLLNSLVCYKGKVFTPINERNLRMGFVCCLTDYEIKIYDKGKQAGTPNENLLRLEIKVRKMRFLNDYGFKTLEDLTNVNKAYSAKQIIINILNGIIWTDNTVSKKLFSNREMKQWLKYENPRTWQSLQGKENLRYARNKWKCLLEKYATPPDLLPLFLATWESLFIENLEAYNTTPIHQINEKRSISKTTPFHSLNKRCKGGKIDNLQNAGFSNKKNNNISKENRKKERVCKSCKKDISHQRGQSVFCSKNYVGEKLAKQCRNKDSNKRKAKKKTFDKAIKNDNYLLVTYKDNFNQSYADILHPTEIELSKNLFNQIQEIKIISQ